MKHEDLKYMSVPLPEDIMKEKWSGNFDRARKIIKMRLESGQLPKAMVARLEIELNNMDVMEKWYTVSEEDAFAQVVSKIPDMTREEFEQLRLENKMDWIYLNGEVRYLRSFCKTLCKVYPEFWPRIIDRAEDEEGAVDKLIKNLKDGDTTSAHIHINHKLEIKADAVKAPGKLRVHIPVPQENDHVQNLKIIGVSPLPKKVPEELEAQPSMYFEESSDVLKYEVEYSFDNVRKYVDLSKAALEKMGAPKSTEIPEDVMKYTKEQLPHIQFTTYLKALAEEIKGDETNPLLVARKIYDYITTKIDYRFVRAYAAIDNITEYCATTSRGDCGIQALLFITLCRISGIPAKWESGIDAKPGDVGEHDWAAFYIADYGWLYADLSYGGSAYVRKAYDRWEYFFGNVDPYRIPINSEFQAPLLPRKNYWRIDPYDNQCGEAECEEYGFANHEIMTDFEEIDIHLIEPKK